MKILIAEDEPISNLWLKTILVKWGHEVISTRNGCEAWDVLNCDNPPELALLDWEMPGMRGIDVCSNVKKSPQAENVYVILITGNDLDENMFNGSTASPDDYIKKPFDKLMLGAKLNLAELKIKF